MIETQINRAQRLARVSYSQHEVLSGGLVKDWVSSEMLKNTVALVIGGASGLGRATAER